MFEKVETDTYTDGSCEEWPAIESGIVARHRGYRVAECSESESTPDDRPHRIGYAVIGMHRFKVHALHRQAINEEQSYTMVAGEGLEYWVIGRIGGSGLIQKHSVLRMYGEDRERLRQLKLGSMQYSEYS